MNIIGNNISILKKNICFLENNFITQFMPDAGEMEIKVYLYLLYMAEDNNISIKSLLQALHITQIQFENAINYWTSRGLIKVSGNYKKDGEIYFANVPDRQSDFEIRKLDEITACIESEINRKLSRNEEDEISLYLSTSKIDITAFPLICKYYADNNRASYWIKIAKTYESKEEFTYNEIKNDLELKQLIKPYAALFKKASILNDSDKETIKSWHADGYSADKLNIFIQTWGFCVPNIAYLNSFVQKMKSMKIKSKPQILNYADALKNAYKYSEMLKEKNVKVNYSLEETQNLFFYLASNTSVNVFAKIAETFGTVFKTNYDDVYNILNNIKLNIDVMGYDEWLSDFEYIIEELKDLIKSNNIDLKLNYIMYTNYLSIHAISGEKSNKLKKETLKYIFKEYADKKNPFAYINNVIEKMQKTNNYSYDNAVSIIAKDTKTVKHNKKNKIINTTVKTVSIDDFLGD